MPYRPNTPCRHPGCAALVPYGQKYCEKHKALHRKKCGQLQSTGTEGNGRKPAGNTWRAQAFCRSGGA